MSATQCVNIDDLYEKQQNAYTYSYFFTATLLVEGQEALDWRVVCF